MFAILTGLIMLFFGGSTRREMTEGEDSVRHEMTEGEDDSRQETAKKEDDARADFEIIAHALGGIDGYAYLNCKEGFLEAYQKGCRFFEVDLTRTTDLEWVCRHSWTESYGQWEEGSGVRRLTKEEFLSRPLMGQYTPLSLENLFELLKDYPDAYVMLDSKHYSIRNYRNTLRDYSEIVQTASDAGAEEVLDRVIPEIYNESMFSGTAVVYTFPSYVFSMWEDQTIDEMEETAAFCEENGISWVTMNKDNWSDSAQDVFDRHGIQVCLYTVNDREEAQRYSRGGVKGICTDWLVPSK